MKMVKSLLLGSAAGLVAVAGAQAADLPVKAKPVEYVKICSIYGAGFFYIPGTDTCIKIGGWVRAEYALGETGNSHAQFMAGGGGRNNRINSTDIALPRPYGHLARRAHPDRIRHRARLQPLRLHGTTRRRRRPALLYTERAFIQIAGFTFGKTQSYFDFVGGAVCYGCGYGGHLSQYRRGRHDRVRLLGNARQRLHRDDRARRRHPAPRARSGMPANDATNALIDRRHARPDRCRVRTPAPSAARRSATTRRTRCPTSSARCVSTRPGARRRSLRRRTSFAAAGTATTRPAPAPTARRSLAPEDTFGFAVDAGVIDQPAVGQGRPVLRRRRVH